MVTEITGDLPSHEQSTPLVESDESRGDGSPDRSNLTTLRVSTTTTSNHNSPHVHNIPHPQSTEVASTKSLDLNLIGQPNISSKAPNSSDVIENDPTIYHMKWIPWNNGTIPIVMQSINGPCPLIATMNVLLLREKVKLPDMLEQITENQLLAYIGESIMDSVQTNDMQNDDNILLNLEQNIHDAIEILPKLKTGLDVNIRFTGITDFEYTPECIIFDLLRIPMFHGWLIDPELRELQASIGNLSYNQLVDYIITHKSSQDPLISTRVLIAEEFLEKTATQLTGYGLKSLKSKIKDNEIGILFRNNHFLTLFKRDGEIYTLVTDHGYLTEDNIVWETLDNIEGAGLYFDSNFKLFELTQRHVSEFKAIDQVRQQMVSDYLVALSFKQKEDEASRREEDLMLELDHVVAKELQAQEDGLVNYFERPQTQVSSIGPDHALVEQQTINEASTSRATKKESSQNKQDRWPTPAQAENDRLVDFKDSAEKEVRTQHKVVGREHKDLAITQNQQAILPTSVECIEVVPKRQNAENGEHKQNEAYNLAHHQRVEGQSLKTSVINTTRSHQHREDPPAMIDQASYFQNQRRSETGRNNNNRPRSEKSRESTCRVH